MLKNVKKILVITLTNIGDVVLTTPVIGILKREFPDARLSVMLGPRARGLLEGAPGIDLIVYDKRGSAKQKSRLLFRLRRQRYDLVVDLRNTIFPLLIGTRYRTGLFSRVPPSVVHMKERHLYKLSSLGMSVEDAPFFIWITEDDLSRARELVNSSRVDRGNRLVAISPGARSNIKRWFANGFAETADRLIEEEKVEIIMLGDSEDKSLIREIIQMMRHNPIDLSGRTSLKEAAAILKKCVLHITNDSAPMHIGAALKVPTLAIFGPTDWRKYGPAGNQDVILHSALDCSPCGQAECRYNHECMKSVFPEQVYRTARRMLIS